MSNTLGSLEETIIGCETEKSVELTRKALDEGINAERVVLRPASQHWM